VTTRSSVGTKGLGGTGPAEIGEAARTSDTGKVTVADPAGDLGRAEGMARVAGTGRAVGTGRTAGAGRAADADPVPGDAPTSIREDSVVATVVGGPPRAALGDAVVRNVRAGHPGNARHKGPRVVGDRGRSGRIAGASASGTKAGRRIAVGDRSPTGPFGASGSEDRCRGRTNVATGRFSGTSAQPLGSAHSRGGSGPSRRDSAHSRRDSAHSRRALGKRTAAREPSSLVAGSRPRRRI
jgi:hypothetical protein